MTTIKVPKIIYIGSHPYTIRFDSSLPDRQLNGELNRHKLEISINPELVASQMMEALIHEFVHTTEGIYYSGEAIPETGVNGISEGLTQILRQLDIEFDWQDIK